MKPKYHIEDYLGKTLGNLTILTKSEKSNKATTNFAKAQCICGKIIELPLSDIARGHSRSCGCQKDGNVTHGYTKHLTYLLWRHIKSRCLNPNVRSFHRYGGRGITICNEWIDDAKSFCDWCCLNGWKQGLQIDRINNNKGYSPDNCRFVTPIVNSRNKENNTRLTYNGQTKTIGEWSEFLGINCHTISDRLNKGRPIEDVLSQTKLLRLR